MHIIILVNVGALCRGSRYKIVCYRSYELKCSVLKSFILVSSNQFFFVILLLIHDLKNIDEDNESRDFQ